MSLRHLGVVLGNGTPALVKKLSTTAKEIITNYLNIMVALTTVAIAARGIQSDFMQIFYCIPTGMGRALVTMVGIYYSSNNLKGLRFLYCLQEGLFPRDTLGVRSRRASPIPYNVDVMSHGRRCAMQHECKITVLETKCFEDYQEKYLADPKSGPCPFFKPGDEFVLKRTPRQDDFYHLMDGRFCGEAWDAVS